MTMDDFTKELEDLINRAVKDGVDAGEIIAEMEGIIDELKFDD